MGEIPALAGCDGADDEPYEHQQSIRVMSVSLDSRLPGRPEGRVVKRARGSSGDGRPVLAISRRRASAVVAVVFAVRRFMCRRIGSVAGLPVAG